MRNDEQGGDDLKGKELFSRTWAGSEAGGARALRGDEGIVCLAEMSSGRSGRVGQQKE